MSAEGWTPRDAEPYQPGNLESVKHGAYSPRLLEVTVTEIIREVETYAPWIAESDAPEVRAWLLAEARCRRLTIYIEEHGEIDKKGDERDAAKALRAWSKIAADRRAALGLNPRSRLDLASKTAGAQHQAALAAQLEEGRKLREAAEARSLQESSDDDESSEEGGLDE